MHDAGGSRRWRSRGDGSSRAGLRDTIEGFRADEIEHRDTALAHDAEGAPGYRLLSAIIKTGCRAAIAISERV